VQGERPYSWIKITLAVLLVIAIIGTIVYFANQ
jgi:preprotein translocase subunit SecE